jgi:hypothetical protein
MDGFTMGCCPELPGMPFTADAIPLAQLLVVSVL